MRLFKKVVSFSLAALMALSVTSCGLAGDDAPASATKSETGTSGSGDPLKIAITPWNPCMFLSLAEELGYFDKAGIDVDLVDFAQFSDVPTAFNAGELDGAFFSSFEVVAPYSMGVDLKVVAIADKSVGADALLAGKDYKNIESLKGKSIGVGFDSISHIYLLLLLQTMGYSADDFELIDMNETARAQALVNGQIDATAIFEPFVTAIQKEGDGINVISDTSDTPDLINDCIAFSGSVVSEREEDVAKVMKCWYDAMDYWKENEVEATKIMAEKLEVTPEDFTETMSKLQMLTAKESLTMLSDDSDSGWSKNMQLICEFLNERGMVEEVSEMSGVIATGPLEKVVSME